MSIMAKTTKSRRRNSAASSVEKAKRAMPKSGAMEMPTELHEKADKGIVHAKDVFRNTKTADATHLSQHTDGAAAKGATNYSLRAIEMARTNTNAAFDYA